MDQDDMTRYQDTEKNPMTSGVPKCPTCGPTRLEPHPRLPVMRCVNCKEHASFAADERVVFIAPDGYRSHAIGTAEDEAHIAVAALYLSAREARLRTQVAQELRAYAEYLRASGLPDVAVEVVRHGADRVECRLCPEGLCSAHRPLELIAPSPLREGEVN